MVDLVFIVVVINFYYMVEEVVGCIVLWRIEFSVF